MNREILNSDAFQRAELKSETYRIYGILILLGALLVWTVLRSLVIGHLRLLLSLTIVAMVYELFMLWAVRRALAGEARVPSTFSLINAFVEAQIPTLTLVILIRNQVLSPYQVLVAPAMLAYYFFIILSTLRISARLSFFTALSSAIGYIGVVWYVESNNPAQIDPAGFPLPVYYVYALSILVSGGVAAFVASQIRTHVMAALRESNCKVNLSRSNMTLMSLSLFSKDSCQPKLQIWANTKFPDGTSQRTKPAATILIGINCMTAYTPSALLTRQATASGRRWSVPRAVRMPGQAYCRMEPEKAFSIN